MKPRRLGVLFLLSFCVFLKPSASAETLDTPHFLILYSTADASMAQTIADSLERARDTLTDALGVSHDQRLKIKIVPSLAPEGYARYVPRSNTMEILSTETMTRRFGGNPPPSRFIEGVLWHEYVHVLQHRAMRRFIEDRSALWFIEGTAELLGSQRFIPPYRPEDVWQNGEAILSGGRLPTLDDLNSYLMTNRYSVPTYFFASDAVAHLVQTWGMESLRSITRCMGEGKKLPDCLREHVGIDLKAFETDWHESLEKRYRAHMRHS